MDNDIRGNKGDGQARLEPLRLLVVEDHADTARMLGRLLGSAGYKVWTASDAAGALELAAREKFDLLVSDIGLPDATGYQLMQQLRSEYGITGIAMSGYGMDEDIRKSQEAGFSDHLVKPISFAQLNESIQRLTQS
jgi:CheY-like chemotaxis protein